jgi:Fe-S cluster assembly protein SufD
MTVTDRYVAAFEALEREGALTGPAWLGPRRRSAIARFAARGWPTTRDEDWRYTSLADLVASPFPPAAGPAPGELPAGALARLALDGPEWPRLAFVDGRHAVRHSSRPPLAGGAQLASLVDAMAADGEVLEHHLGRHATGDDDVFAALSTAFARDGAVLRVPADTSLPTPVELVFVSATPGVLTQPRVLLVVEAGSRATVVERHLGLTGRAYFANAVTEIVVGPGATVEHYILQEEGAGALRVATVHAALGRDGTFSTLGVTFGARLGRTNLAVRFGGEGGRATLGGLYVVGGRQHVDHHVTVDHTVPRCTSRQLYKGVLDGQARAVFNGRILVRRDAQKTDANQTNKHLLLSEGVEVDSKPQLEIFADDVKCTHGAAEGQLAPEALFYLKSRGLGDQTARALLTYGFAREVVERIAVAPLQAYLDRALMARLHGSRAREES